MEDYKIRLIKEYQELVNRYDRLSDMLYKYKHNELDFVPNCPYEILAIQQPIMMAYINILIERANIEGIDLLTHIDNIDNIEGK